MYRFWIILQLAFLVFSHHGIGQTLQVDSITVTYKYLVHIPKEVPSSGKYPLLLFLHGAGSRGNDIQLVGTNNPLRFAPNTENFPFLLVAPQCPAGAKWNEDVLLQVLDEIEKKYPIDREREYVTGLSMGGNAVWKLIQRAPDRFAAAAPVCGWGDSTNVCLLKYTPVWAFHGKEDKTISCQKSIEMINALNHSGGLGKLSIYKNVAHNSWGNTYAEKALYEWFLQQKRIGKEITINKKNQKKYVGTYPYKGNGNAFDTFVLLENDDLWYSVPHYNFKVRMYMVSENLFRLQGIPLAGDSELYFETDKNGKVTGHYYYPCDKTFVPKTN